MKKLPAFSLALLLGVSAAGCASRTKPVQNAGAVHVPEQLDAVSAVRVERAYRRLAPSNPQRAEIRASLVRFLAAEAERVHAADEYDATVEKLARISSLYYPGELEGGLLPETLALAKYLRMQGEPKGDEPRVLSALWLEKTLEPHNPEPKTQYEQLRRWSDEARANLGGVADHLSGLIQVLAEHARLTPAPDILDTLANLYAERRQKLVKALGPDDSRRRRRASSRFRTIERPRSHSAERPSTSRECISRTTTSRAPWRACDSSTR